MNKKKKTLIGIESGVNMNNKYQIRVHSGSLRGQAFIINKPEFKIGRDPSCDIILTENSVSRIHLIIYHQDMNNVVLVDNNSTNGTTVNNMPVTTPVQITENSVIMLGGEVALVLEKVPEMQTPYAPFPPQNYQSNLNNPYAQSNMIPSYQPPVPENGSSNIPNANDLLKNQIGSIKSNPNTNLTEDINLEKIQNNDMEDKMNPKSGENSQPNFGQPQGNNSTPIYRQQNNIPDFNRPYPQAYPDQPYPYQQNFNQQPYPGQQIPQYQPMNPAFGQSQFPNPQNSNYPVPGQMNADNSQFNMPQSQSSQYPGQPWNQPQNPYAAPVPYGQNPNEFPQQPWMANQPYPQSGYMNNPVQQGYGQQGNVPQNNPYYGGGYPGYPQNYGYQAGYPQNEENQADEEAQKRKKLYIILGAVLLFIIAIIVFIIIIDTNYLWCDVFPFLWSAEACAIYP
jgi:hypothetical protein